MKIVVVGNEWVEMFYDKVKVLVVNYYDLEVNKIGYYFIYLLNVLE